MKYVILNFSYGYGPFLITTKLALTVNQMLEKKTGKRFGIIVPLVYGNKQKRIMKEEFGEIIKKHPNEIVYDKTLGEYLKNIFYGEKKYEESLRYYLRNYKVINSQIASYLKKGLYTETFTGQKRTVKKSEIAFAITRAPRFDFGIKPAYYTSFAYVSEILEKAIKEKGVATDKKLFEKLISIYSKIEKNHDIHFIAEPATFYYLKNKKRRHRSEVLTPPKTVLPPKLTNSHQVKRGIYTTITGISCLKKLFEQAHQIKLRIYTNKPDAITGSKKALPNVIGCRKIQLHFARSGWGSIWLSLFFETPFVALPYESRDDPEMYFNNLCLEKIGLGKVYREESLEELVDFGKEYKKTAKKIKKSLIVKYGTLDGITYAAEKIINNFLHL
jgi:hypothetical protein